MMRSRPSFVARQRGFTLLESMIALLIGVVVFGMLLESVVFLTRQGLWLSCHQSAQAEADGLRLYLARDLYFADELKVEDRDGTHLTVSGPITGLYNVEDPAVSAGGTMPVYQDSTNRFSITYVYTPPDSGNGPGRLIRYGPAYQEGDTGVPVMIDPENPVGTTLSSLLQSQDANPVFQLIGRGKVRVSLRVRQLLSGMFWGGTSDPANGTRTVDVNLTAIAQKMD